MVSYYIEWVEIEPDSGFEMTPKWTKISSKRSQTYFPKKYSDTKNKEFVLHFITFIPVKGNIMIIVVHQCRELTISNKLLPSPTRSEVFTSVSNPIVEHNSHFLKCVISANNSARKTALNKTISCGRSFSKPWFLNLPTNVLHTGLGLFILNAE